MSDPKNQNKLAIARTRLILDKPFLGALVLRLPLVAADPSWCKTATTDARKLYFNPEYVESLDIQETQFVLAKQALHCALSHFSRRHHRIRQRWQLACDYAVNPLLIHDGLRPPPGNPVDENFEGMTAEEIYRCIDEFDDEDSEFENQSNTSGTRETATRSKGSKMASRNRHRHNPASQVSKMKPVKPRSWHDNLPS